MSWIKQSLKRDLALPVLRFFIILILFPTTVFAQDKQQASEQQSQQTKQQLTELQQDIKAQKQQLEKANKNFSKLELQLKENELKIGQQARKLNQITQDLTATRARIAELNKRQKTLEKEKAQQEDALAQQLRSAYASGHHDYVKLLLNQQEPSKVQRTLTYYQYVNQARMESIDEFQRTIKELIAVEQEQIAQAKKLEQAITEQKKQQLLLKAEQKDREQTLAQLSKRVLTNQQKLDQLISQEEQLASALKRIQERIAQQREAQRLARLEAQKEAERKAREAEQQGKTVQMPTPSSYIELTGLGNLEKRLNWPVRGKIKHNFGSRKQGYLKWKGVLLTANLGASVKTIHHGTVLFADWLKGYGLVMVIDHGDGYMSLYGHNQTLLKNVGDIVESGESIALVGQSGGQAESSLYFEIRHQGQARNPKAWCR